MRRSTPRWCGSPASASQPAICRGRAGFPYIALGSPQFLHYQSLAAVLTGVLAQIISPASAVAWTTYLLLGTWPICVYISRSALLALAHGLRPARPWRALSCRAPSAPATSSGLTSSSGTDSGPSSSRCGACRSPGGSPGAPINYRQAQAGGRCRRRGHDLHALRDRVPVAAPPFDLAVAGSQGSCTAPEGRLFVGATGLVVSSWAWVPLVPKRNGPASTRCLAGTKYQQGYGASRMLSWLFRGRVFDSGSAIAIISILAVFGLLFSLFAGAARSPVEPPSRSRSPLSFSNAASRHSVPWRTSSPATRTCSFAVSRWGSSSRPCCSPVRD